jgi:hypothetical protein
MMASGMKRLRLLKKIILAGLICCAVAVTLLLAGLIAPGLPSAPPAWSQIHAGLKRDDILRIAGTPNVSFYPEKIAETWYVTAWGGTRRMVVFYRGERGESVSEAAIPAFALRTIVTRWERGAALSQGGN